MNKNANNLLQPVPKTNYSVGQFWSRFERSTVHFIAHESCEQHPRDLRHRVHNTVVKQACKFR